MDFIGDTENLILLLEIAGVGVAVYLVYRYLTNKGGTDCGPNGGQKCCDPSQVNTDACVGADGNPCGIWEFWTATSCYQGTPAVTVEQIQASREASSTLGGIGALFTGPFTGSTDTPGAPAPGLPAGYNPVTGTIDTGGSTVNPLAMGPASPSLLPDLSGTSSSW